MIAKCIKGTGFRGAIEYDLQPHKSLLLETNMAGQNPRELAREFGMIRVLRPNLQKAVCHVSLSLSPEESLTDDQWRHVAQTWLQGMGFEANQYVVSRHTDAAHSHIHILVNRVTFDGQVVSDAHDYKRQEPIMRALEQELDLRVVLSSAHTQRTALKKGEVEQAVRTQEQPTRLVLQELIDISLAQVANGNSNTSSSTLTVDFVHFCESLRKQGVEVRLNQASTGFISGISFAMNGIAFKGSKLGKAYTWTGLQKRGLYYEQNGHDTKHGQTRTQETTNGGASFADGRGPSAYVEVQAAIRNSDTVQPSVAQPNISRASETRSKPDGFELTGGGTHTNYTRAYEAFDEIKRKYNTSQRKRGHSRSRSAKLSR